MSCANDSSAYGFLPSLAQGIEVQESAYSIKCLDTKGDVVDLLQECACDIGLGDFTTLSRVVVRDVNISFSPPIHVTAYAVITRTHSQANIWALFKPFQPSLWVLILLTPFFLAIFMTYFAWTISKYKNDNSFRWSSLPQFTFQNTMSLFNEYSDVEYMDWKGKHPYMVLLKMSLQGMLVAYAFLCLIIAAVYTAELTNMIFDRRMQRQERTFEEIIRTAETLYSPPELMSYIRSRYNINPNVWIPESTESVIDIVRRVRQGTIDAAIGTYTVLAWAAYRASGKCDVSLTKGTFSPEVLLYSGCIDSQTKAQIDARIYALKQRGVFDQLEESLLPKYDINAPLPCFAPQQEAISIYDLGGGWVILAGAVCIPFLLTVSRYLYYLLWQCVQTYGTIFVLPPTFDGSRSMKRQGGQMPETDCQPPSIVIDQNTPVHTPTNPSGTPETGSPMGVRHHPYQIHHYTHSTPRGSIDSRRSIHRSHSEPSAPSEPMSDTPNAPANSPAETSEETGRTSEDLIYRDAGIRGYKTD